MKYHEYIRQTLCYIEAHLTEELSIPLLAREAGYSPYHFLRVFRQVVGLTPADYIRKRRLSEIARQLGEDSDQSIAEIAFSYGFNSKENFIRAFRSEHRVLPSEYRAAQNSLMLFQPYNLDPEPFVLFPERVKLDGFHLRVYLSDERLPAIFWNKYNCRKLSLKLGGRMDLMDYGVSLWNSETRHLDYFIGIREEEAAGDTRGTVRLNIQGGDYAVFTTPPATHYNFVNQIHRTWRYIPVWLEQNGFQRTVGYEFECYVDSSRTYCEKIYIPIKMRKD